MLILIGLYENPNIFKFINFHNWELWQQSSIFPFILNFECVTTSLFHEIFQWSLRLRVMYETLMFWVLWGYSIHQIPTERKAPQFLIISIGSNVIFPTLQITALYLRKSVWPSELCGVQPAQTSVQRIRCQSAPSNVP